ncbi:hypothetical protein EV284_4137 [Streptomyces sp. BK022]|uniref:hypothetical protein n=1 Tax=Streptomyces sp. BK022 TaxID=2512123 RepID=UPI0010ECC933|nr:hypothetical protein [Streptomyces sp. BK022]RZU36642.1 hypothetical protein EV284_4137 [Streptomyces sp. BK022]
MPRIVVLLLAPAALLVAIGAGVSPETVQDAPVTRHAVAGDGFGWGTPTGGDPA